MEKTRGFEAGGIRYRLLRFPCLWTLGNIFIFGRWSKRNAELRERLLPPLEVLDAIQICPLLGPTGQFGFDAVWYTVWCTGGRDRYTGRFGLKHLLCMCTKLYCSWRFCLPSSTECVHACIDALSHLIIYRLCVAPVKTTLICIVII